MKKLLLLILALTVCMSLFIVSCSDDSDSENNADGDTETDGETAWVPIDPKVEKVGLYNVAYLKGTAREMGKQHGELFHDIIKEAMEFVANDTLLSLIPTIAKDAGVIELAQKTSYKDILDECEGMVEATKDVGFTMEFCLVLNFGDVMLEKIDHLLPRPKGPAENGPGCSEVIAAGDATPDNRIYHARNLDWGSMNIDIIHKYPTIFIRQPSDGIPHMYVGFPLNITPYTGMNAEGISACSNEIDPVDNSEKDEEGRSHAQMLGQILKKHKTLDEIADFLKNEDHMSSELLVVADGNNQKGAVFEMTAKHFHQRSLEDGLIYATNHFVSDEMKDYDLVQDVEKGDSSLLRWERFEQLIKKDATDTLYGNLSLENLAKVMRDRVNPRTQEEAGPNVLDNDAGLSSNGPMHFVLFDPEKLLFWVSAGKKPIYQQPYQCFSLGELLGYKDATKCEPSEY